MTTPQAPKLPVKRKGDEVEYTITYLDMLERPSFPRPSIIGKAPTALIHATAPPVWYFLSLYDAVGCQYEWVDRHDQPAEELEAFVNDDKVHLYTFLRDGWPNGFFMLDTRKEDVCDIAYLGLVPQAIGQGLGKFLLQTAIHSAWDMPGTKRVTLNTCTLDHPRALAHYQKHGFKPYGQETLSRILTQDWDPNGFP